MPAATGIDGIPLSDCDGVAVTVGDGAAPPVVVSSAAVAGETIFGIVEMVATGYPATVRRPVAAFVKTSIHGSAVAAVGNHRSQ